MTEPVFYRYLLGSYFVLAAITFVALFFVTAPYGRYIRERWGALLPRRLGWVLMEAPSPIAFAVCFLLGDRHGNAAAIAFLAMWQIHYVHRTFIFPFRMRGDSKRVTLATVGLAVVFNCMNGYLNGRYLNTLGPLYPESWLLGPQFLVGAALFAVGLAINLQSDGILIGLRGPGETGYKIPRGGLFSLVSCPNYFGEIVEWSGWAVATWSLPGLGFAVWTAANLVPRAVSHHLWYRQKFPDYPKERRAVVPFVL